MACPNGRLTFTGVTVSAALAIVTTTAPPPVPVRFAAPRLTANTPASRGVPLISPEALFTLSPAGSPVAVKEIGVRLALIA